MEAHMDNLKIRVKVGDHEFEAEGPRESVELQFQLFKELVGAAPVRTPGQAPPAPKPPVIQTPTQNGGLVDETPDKTVYDRLFSVDGDRLSLHYLPEGENREANALLILLLGYRIITAQEQVLGGRLMQGLQQSGLTLDRIDRVLDPYIPSLILKTGIKKGTKYRLTNIGLARAKVIAEEQLKILG
jgi:hypothetical protein